MEIELLFKIVVNAVLNKEVTSSSEILRTVYMTAGCQSTEDHNLNKINISIPSAFL
jgi:hypothetical protein